MPVNGSCDASWRNCSWSTVSCDSECCNLPAFEDDARLIGEHLEQAQSSSSKPETSPRRLAISMVPTMLFSPRSTTAMASRRPRCSRNPLGSPSVLPCVLRSSGESRRSLLMN